MLSHASYPALDSRPHRSQSRAIVTGPAPAAARLRGRGRDGQPGGRRGAGALGDRGRRGALDQGGADLILMTGSASWNAVYPRLLAEARSDPAFRKQIRDARRAGARVEGLSYSAERARSSARSISSLWTPRVLPVRRVQLPSGPSSQREGVVGQVALEGVLEPRAQGLVAHRREQLDARVEVPRHQVRRADPVLALVAALEAVDPRVLEEAAHHGDHA